VPALVLWEVELDEHVDFVVVHVLQRLFPRQPGELDATLLLCPRIRCGTPIVLEGLVVVVVEGVGRFTVTTSSIAATSITFPAIINKTINTAFVTTAFIAAHGVVDVLDAALDVVDALDALVDALDALVDALAN